jgi:hypothetical protein
MINREIQKNASSKPELYTVLTTGRVLKLTLKKHWFDMISKGIKPEEYREVKAYWTKRLLLDKNGDKLNQFNAEDLTEAIKYAYSGMCDGEELAKESIIQYDKIVFRNGYSKEAPTMVFEYKGLKIGSGKLEWGADEDDFYFKLLLGEKLYDSTEC